MNNDYVQDYLMHHGILGQKWGVRRYQNEDGSLTPAGKKRYQDIYDEYKNASAAVDKAEKNYLYENGVLRNIFRTDALSGGHSDTYKRDTKFYNDNNEFISKYIIRNPKGVAVDTLVKSYAEYVARNGNSSDAYMHLFHEWYRNECTKKYGVELDQLKTSVDIAIIQNAKYYDEYVDHLDAKVDYEKALDRLDVATKNYEELVNNPKYTVSVNNGKVYVKNNQSFLSRVVSQVKQVAKKVSNLLSNLFTTSSSKKWS